MKSGHCHTLHGAKDKDGSSMGRGYKSISKLSIVFRRALLLVLLCCAAALGSATAHAQSASTWNKRGQQAEARQNYDAAMEDYHQAMLKNPSDLRYKTRYEHNRFLASVGHVDRGRVLRQSGDFNGALTEFKRALEIDPANQTAQQEIDQLEQAMQNPQANGAAPERSEQLSTP
jgi:general secretion pathway protein D